MWSLVDTEHGAAYVGRTGNFIRNLLLGGWLYSSQWQPGDMVVVIHCQRAPH
jgi:ribosomal protein L13